MANLDETDTPEEKEQEQKPDGETERQSPDQGVADKEDPLKVLAELPLDTILESREDLRRRIQSERDKAGAAAARHFQDELKARSDAAERARRAEEERRLAAEGDFDAIGRKYWDASVVEGQRAQYGQEFNAMMEEAVRQHPEFAALGEDTIGEVYSNVLARKGNIVDLVAGLASKRRQADKDALTDSIRKEQAEAMKTERESLRSEITKELEATLAEHGIERRKREAEGGGGASRAVSGGAGGAAQKPKTWEEATDAYNRGEMSEADYAPFKKAHEDERHPWRAPEGYRT